MRNDERGERLKKKGGEQHSWISQLGPRRRAWRFSKASNEGEAPTSSELWLDVGHLPSDQFTSLFLAICRLTDPSTVLAIIRSLTIPSRSNLGHLTFHQLTQFHILHNQS
ncbi:hypothetical protein AB6A40_010910 [Gnathostoma spinigerum]|uniref:Uncharacterized protein n=1 Tax=Gnathostoma spinigerum TaxID=75299 RepID=A0ABD6EWC9_9BILA